MHTYVKGEAEVETSSFGLSSLRAVLFWVEIHVWNHQFCSLVEIGLNARGFNLNVETGCAGVMVGCLS
jgi:hypothetical protein